MPSRRRNNNNNNNQPRRQGAQRSGGGAARAPAFRFEPGEKQFPGAPQILSITLGDVGDAAPGQGSVTPTAPSPAPPNVRIIGYRFSFSSATPDESFVLGTKFVKSGAHHVPVGGTIPPLAVVGSPDSTVVVRVTTTFFYKDM